MELSAIGEQVFAVESIRKKRVRKVGCGGAGRAGPRREEEEEEEGGQRDTPPRRPFCLTQGRREGVGGGGARERGRPAFSPAPAPRAP